MGVLKQLQGRQWETTHRWSSPTRTRLGSARTSTSSTRSAPAPSPSPTWAPCSAPSATNKTQEQMEEEIKNAFLTFDADGSGFIDRDELVNVLTTMGDPVDEETINGMIAEADVDGDGKINYAEFTKIMLES